MPTSTLEPDRQGPLLKLREISKRFGNTLALNRVTLQVDRGEAIGLIGENGAGKSTLMKVLAGVVVPDSGEVSVDGKAVDWRSPGEAIAAGIALIHQELNLHDNLSVAENLFLGREPTRLGLGLLRVLNRRELDRQSTLALRRVGLGDVSPRQTVGSLPIAVKQLIEIARALAMDARIVVMDEPTSSLSDEEASRLLKLIERLQAEGVAVIYISHRLHEIEALAQRVEVMRDGCHVETLIGEDISHDTMVRAMVGRDLASRTHPSVQQNDQVESQSETVLQRGLAVADLKVERTDATPVSFHVRPGEVVALVGLMGAGRTEILETIFGMRRSFGGKVFVNGQEVDRTVQAAIQAGIALVPEDRKESGLLIHSDVNDNLALVAMAARGKTRSRAWQNELSDGLISQLNIKTSSASAVVASLSGGNQQKVALAKWLATEFQVLMLDEPTRGVDIGAKSEIYQLIDQIASEGKSVLVVSSEMEEVFALADRVLVVCEGAITGELQGEKMTEEAIMHLAIADSNRLAKEGSQEYAI